MDNRGFLKNSGDHKRMRFVQPPYLATDMATPPNKVIFDSDDLGTLSLITTGSYTFAASPTLDIPRTKIASWNLDYVPLCLFQFQQAGDDVRMAWYMNGYNINFNITAEKTGIYASIRRGQVVSTGLGVVVTVFYQAYRLEVTR